MIRVLKFTLLFFLMINISNNLFSNEKFFNKGIKLYENKKYDDAKFMFEKSIVFNPKDSNSYLYLARIYNIKDDKKKEEKNLQATLLIDPNNEE